MMELAELIYYKADFMSTAAAKHLAGHLIANGAEMRKIAHWQWNGKCWECSNCRGNRFHDLMLGLDAAYCGYCGAKMTGDE